MGKIVFTVLWAGVVIAVNSVLDDFIWAQYLSTFALGGIYAFTVDKVPGPRGKSPQEGQSL
ncbi:hypothetical protein [Streptomyces decoyicus]|uniref:hypothetical protein n=1 Tax=Streptomyces decoyicus TaxID=249567 RepID=UPI0004AAE1AA|nr:hypothetical protein [Streptomyces decoyicus]KOG49698.1 hypothetical protein ADK74_04055 [Streptomyces decoyicus]QZY17220.1 hypothetical protein K7C20_19775 [Streptomyces decoyicus]